MMRYSRYFALFTIALTYGQQVGENKTGNDVPNFTVTRQLKIETVLVKDKNGNPVEGEFLESWDQMEGVYEGSRFPPRTWPKSTAP